MSEDLVDYLRHRLAHATDPVCTCPDCDVSSLWDAARGEYHTVKGWAADCAIHGVDGTEPTRRRAS